MHDTESVKQSVYFVLITWFVEFKPIMELMRISWWNVCTVLILALCLIPRCHPECWSDPDHAFSAQSEGLSLDQDSGELWELGSRGGVPSLGPRENRSWWTGAEKTTIHCCVRFELCVYFKAVCVLSRLYGTQRIRVWRGRCTELLISGTAWGFSLTLLTMMGR